MSTPLRPVDDQLAEVLATVGPLEVLDLSLLDAHGCALAEDVVAPAPLPGFDHSAMDGYAVRATDLAGASRAAPVALPVVGDVAAGDHGRYTVQPGLCVRIMTGAPVPVGADTVVPVEWTDGGVQTVRVTRAPEPGAHVRHAGEEVAAGATVLTAGTHLGATQVAVLAAVGRDRVRARPRPRVVVLSTGSELVEPGQPLSPGRIHDSNSFALTAASREAGALAYRVGVAPDDATAFRTALEDQLIRADAVVTSGGVSVGAYDVVKEVLAPSPGMSFTKVAMQPGMPQGFGTYGPDATPLFCLPGNPVSAYVSFEVFVRPALRRMLGVEPVNRPQVRARLTQRVTSPPGKRSYLRAELDVVDGVYAVRPVGGPGSHLLVALAQANALVVVPEEVTEVAAGDVVSVMVLERRHA